MFGLGTKAKVYGVFQYFLPRKQILQTRRQSKSTMLTKMKDIWLIGEKSLPMSCKLHCISLWATVHHAPYSVAHFSSRLRWMDNQNNCGILALNTPSLLCFMIAGFVRSPYQRLQRWWRRKEALFHRKMSFARCVTVTHNRADHLLADDSYVPKHTNESLVD
jgi:hypothetical protein